MASVALFNAATSEKIHREIWTRLEKKIAKEAAVNAIIDVGDSNTDAWEEFGSIVTIRRQCRDEERRRVLEKFLSVG